MGGGAQMTRSHRIALDPTVAQIKYFAQAAGTARFTWNWALAEWNSQYEAGGKPKANELKRFWNSIKYERFPWLRKVHRDAHSQPFANLQAAWTTYFKSLKNGSKAGRPKFKKKGKARDSFYVANDKLSFDDCSVRLPVIGFVRLRESLRFVGKIMSATVSREADRWFIAVSVEVPDVVASAPVGDPIGVDLGLTTFAKLSTGEPIFAPRPLRAALKKLRKLGRWFSRKLLGSKNRQRAVMKLALQHRRVKNVRRDFIHKLTTRLAKTHREICIEDLNVNGLLKNHKLALHIADAAWSETRRQLTYKTILYGSTLTVRDRWFASSKLCSECGVKNDSLSLSVREWTCQNCGAIHDRDENAAKNLVKPNTAGYAGIYASGDCGSGRLMLVGETAVGERGTNSCERSLALTI